MLNLIENSRAVSRISVFIMIVGFVILLILMLNVDNNNKLRIISKIVTH